MTDDLLDEVFRRVDRFNAMFREMLDMYERITRRQGRRTGWTAAR